MNHRDMLIAKAHEQLDESAELLFAKNSKSARARINAEKQERLAAEAAAKAPKAKVTVEAPASAGRLLRTTRGRAGAAAAAAGALGAGGTAYGVHRSHRAS